jgi:hypothetical protein
MQKTLRLFASLTKIDESSHEVSGLATAEIVDKEGELFDYESSKPYFKAWTDEMAKATEGKSLGNVREMHQPSAVGKLTGIAFDDELRQISVTARIVDDLAWQKCIQGVYTGFSIGGSYVKVWRDGEFTRYTANPAEISVVDNPCNPGSHFTAVKADGTIEVRKFAAPFRRRAENPARMTRHNMKELTEETKTVQDKMNKAGARHSADTQQHHEAIADCLDACTKALAVAQPHMDALMDKDDGISAAAGANIYKHSPASAEIRAGEQPSMLEGYEKNQLERAQANSAEMLSKIVELERRMIAAAKAEDVQKGFKAIAETLNELAKSIARLAGVTNIDDNNIGAGNIGQVPGGIEETSAPRVARTAIPGNTALSAIITKEQDSAFAPKVTSDDLARMTADERATYELKKALQNPQLIRQTPGYFRSAQ